jgi:hypothetical protein
LLSEALEVARAIGHDIYRTVVLTELARHLPESLLPEALDFVRAIGDEQSRARVLQGLARQLSKVFLLEALDIARAMGTQSNRARALQALTKVLTPANVDQSLWENTLQALGTLTRPCFLATIPNLVPLILHFGGIEALREVHQAIREVSRWWK